MKNLNIFLIKQTPFYLDIFLLVLGDGGYTLAGGGWWWMVVDIFFGCWWVVMGGGGYILTVREW